MVKDLNEIKNVEECKVAPVTIAIATNEENTGALVMLPIDKLYPHPDNPRKSLGDLTELSESIKAKGVMQNLTVVPRAEEYGTYTIIIGHRRHAAAKKAKLKELPCVIVEMSEQEQVATMLLENIQRSDLTAYEQAKGFQMMMDFGDSVAGIVEKTGFSESTVRRRLKMAELDEEVLKKVSSRQISFGDIDKLQEIEDPQTRNKVLEDIGTANFNNSLRTAVANQKRTAVLKKMRDAFEAAGLKEVTWDEYHDFYNYDTSISNPDEVEDRVIHAVERGATAYYFSYSTTFYTLIKKDVTKTTQKSAEQIAREKAEQERRERYAKLVEAFERAYALRREFIDKYPMAQALKNIVKIAAFLVCMGMNDATSDSLCKKDFENLTFGRECELSSYEETCDMLDTPADGAKAMLVAVWLLTDRKLDCYDWKGYYEENEDLNMIYEFLESLGYEMSDEERELLDGTSELYEKGDE